MEDLKIDLVVCKLDKKSSRGFYFQESNVRKYLESDAYKERMSRKNAFCLLTHKARKVSDEETMKNVPSADYLLIEKEVVGFVYQMFLKDGYWMAKVQIFDPDKFTGKTKDSITFVRGLIESGIKLQSSAGIDAYYNPVTKEGEIIYDVVGIDFTQSPDFEDGGMKV